MVFQSFIVYLKINWFKRLIYANFKYLVDEEAILSAIDLSFHLVFTYEVYIFKLAEKESITLPLYSIGPKFVSALNHF